jgi:protein with PEP-CTERM/exosortase system signal
MKFSLKLLLVLAAATAFFLVQAVEAAQIIHGGPTVTVPDGGSTISLLGLALLGVAVLRRKLSR